MKNGIYPKRKFDKRTKNLFQLLLHCQSISLTYNCNKFTIVLHSIKRFQGGIEMKLKSRAFLLFFAVAVLFSVTASEFNTVKTHATTAVKPETKISEESTMQIIPADQLEKEGYVFRLTKTANLFPKFSDNNPYDKKVVKKIIDKNISFKVTEFGTAKTTLMAHIVDKSGKYQGWVSLMSENINNINANKKVFKSLVKAELKVMNLFSDKSEKAAIKAMPQVQAEVKKLRGKNKEIGQTSVKQLKKWMAYKGDDGAYKYIPTLVFGKF